MRGPVLVVGPIEPPIGGVSRYCRSVASLLDREGPGAVQIDPARSSTNGSAPVPAVLRYPAARILGRPTLSILQARARSAATLVLDNQQELWRSRAYARGLRLCLRVPYCLAIHDGAFPAFVGALQEPARRGLSRAFQRAAGILCMSDPILEAVKLIAPGAPARRLSPLLQEPVVPGTSSLPGALQDFLRAGRPVISASGALHPQYGLEELLEAFGELRRGGSRARLIILLGSFVRDEGTSAALAAARAVHGDGTLMTLTDFPDGAAVIAGSDLYVRSSRVDSFGLALHEALLCGVPVVASEPPARPEGVLTYAPGRPGALALAIERGLGGEARAAASKCATRVREAVQRNRRETMALLTALAGASQAMGTG